MDSEFDLAANLAEFRFYGTRDKRQWTWEGRKMARIIKNITTESKKAGYNPETDTNWCHLPMEIREKSIKEMDFKTRTHIRAASRIEKSYVDAHIYHFDKAIFESETAIVSEQFRTKANLPLFTTLEFIKPDPLAASGIERVLPKLYPDWRCETDANTPPFKFCDFREFQCHLKGDIGFANLGKWVTECGPFRFKTLRCKNGNSEIFEYFLKNRWDGEEQIILDFERFENFSIRNVFLFFKVKTVVFEGVPDYRLAGLWDKIVQDWDQLDVEIGTICHLLTGKIGQLVNGRKTCSEVKMRNNSKKIVLEFNWIRIDCPTREVIMKVVHASIPRPTDAPKGN